MNLTQMKTRLWGIVLQSLQRHAPHNGPKSYQNFQNCFSEFCLLKVFWKRYFISWIIVMLLYNSTIHRTQCISNPSQPCLHSYKKIIMLLLCLRCTAAIALQKGQEWVSWAQSKKDAYRVPRKWLYRQSNPTT